MATIDENAVEIYGETTGEEVVEVVENEEVEATEVADAEEI